MISLPAFKGANSTTERIVMKGSRTTSLEPLFSTLEIKSQRRRIDVEASQILKSHVTPADRVEFLN